MKHVYKLFLPVFKQSFVVFNSFQIIGDVDEFEKAVRLVISTVTFDSDIVVSVFETNIRVLGYVCFFS